MISEKYYKEISQTLQPIPKGKISVIRHSASRENLIAYENFHYCSDGKGIVEIYPVFPGFEISLNLYHAHHFVFQHAPLKSIMQINHCRIGRIGWEMQDQTNIYLGPGDLSIHTLDTCAESAMSFPLGYFQGISISIDLETLTKTPPEILRDTGIDGEKLFQKFCKQKNSTAMPASDKISHIFSELYDLPKKLYLPYFKLKVQELLLFLDLLELDQVKSLDQYVSDQVEIIKTIHKQITENPEYRYTIEALSKQYLMNTTSLKSIFKTVYGMPIASYMKEYRMKQAAEMLLHSDKNISEIACAVGYKNQSKFTSAFRDRFQILPTAYQKQYRK